MTEKNEDASMDVDQAGSVVHENSSPNIPTSIQSAMLIEVRNKQEQLLEKLKSVETQFGDKLDTLQFMLKELKAKNKTPQIIDDMEPDKKKQKLVDPLVSKQFVLTHIFKDVSSLEENKHFDSENEEHFGVEWHIAIYRINEKLGCYLQCEGPETKNKWSIETDHEIKKYGSNNNVHSQKGNCCYTKKIGYGNDILKWDDMEKNYLIDDTLKVEIHVEIIETTGIYKENQRKFDESTLDVSDTVLIVDEEKFYVSKLYLAAHSSYFKAMFLGMFDDSKKSEITLTGIDPSDFQKYLELLYGESTVEETAVEGILLVADMFDTQILVRKCEDFLMKKSKKTLKKKLQMSVRYNLEILEKKCLTQIKSADDIRSIIPSDPRDLEPSLATILLEKSLSFR